jgi:hypothetical protein
MEETPSPHEKNQVHISSSLRNTTPMELGQFVNHDISRDILPVEADLARNHLRAVELDLRFRDQVIARQP